MTLKLTALAFASAVLLSNTEAFAQSLPDAPAKNTVATVCSACHDVDTAIAKRRTKEGWQTIVDTMVDRGARGTEEELTAIIEYMAKYFGLVNVNRAASRELQDVLEVPSQAADAIVKYRAANGAFKDLDGLKKVPGLDAKLLDDRKDRISF